MPENSLLAWGKEATNNKIGGERATDLQFHVTAETKGCPVRELF